MNKAISYYYNNCNSLTINDIRNFIMLLCNEEAKKLNIKTNIDIVFRDLNGYGGSLTNNFKLDSSRKLILPLQTTNYILEINDSQVIESYMYCKNEKLEIFPGVKVPKALNALSAIASLCAHEVRHAFQNEQIKDNKIDNVETILWLKLELIRNRFNDIYDNNYEDFFTEQDAYNYQYKLAFSLLDMYSNLDKSTLEKYKGYLKANRIVYCKNKNLKAYFRDLDEPMRKRIGVAYTNELFNRLVKDLPKDYISNSLLKYEYNSDGSKKTYIELMKDKSENKSSDKNLDSVYDFIIECDYNLQVQKIALKIEELEKLEINFEEKEMLKREYIKELKRAYYVQEFNYKEIHILIQEKINSINKQLGDLSIKLFKKQINFMEASEKKKELLNDLSNYRAIEIQILNNIKDYRKQQEEYLQQEETYSKNINLINEYKNKKGFLDIVKDGMIVDITDYNKLIAGVIKELNNPNVDENYKEYLKKVKEAIEIVYFSSTIKENSKSK